MRDASRTVGSFVVLSAFALGASICTSGAQELTPKVTLKRLPTVVDSAGIVLGSTADGGTVLRRVGSSVVRFFVAPDNVYFGCRFLHAAADCSDQRYVVSFFDVGLFPDACLGKDPLNGEPVSFYRGDPLVQLDVQAAELIDPNCTGDLKLALPNGYCCTVEHYFAPARPAVSFSLPVFTAPFSVILDAP